MTTRTTAPTTGHLPPVRPRSSRRERRVENLDILLVRSFELFRAEIIRIADKREIARRKAGGATSEPTGSEEITLRHGVEIEFAFDRCRAEITSLMEAHEIAVQKLLGTPTASHSENLDSRPAAP